MKLHNDFIEEIRDLLPDECDVFLKAVCETDASVSIRTNSRKCKTEPSQLERVKWCEHGYYLQGRQPFTFDPLFQTGCYYVQDASSMILQHIASLLVTEPVRYLDLCAAPGGKTTAALDALPSGSLLVSNEIMSNRAQILKENIIKWGNPDCVVTNNDSATIGKLSHYFDVIAADVPCSGEGMFRKDEEAVAQWTPALVRQCTTRQKEIIDNIWQALRPGGLFIYSTCTYNRQEDENMVEYIINEYGAESIDLNIPEEWGIHHGINTTAHCYRFLPHLTKGEGLFVAVLKKNDDEPIQRVSLRKKGKNSVKTAQTPKEVKQWVDGKFDYAPIGDNIIATPKHIADDIDLLRANLRVVHAGVEVASVKGKDFVPSQALILSTAYNRNAFPCCDIDYATAMAYMRGETVTIDAPRGIVALKYGGIPVGFVKNLGNRANNLYPKEWRIKSTHIPTEAPKIIE